mmetsp:Transcript_55313/g.112939  ORF Transcript_55313/g.112939 Transcript_55313/m.112939 type:complete len:107 (+) Transcript_55313:1503-1823(+)
MTRPGLELPDVADDDDMSSDPIATARVHDDCCRASGVHREKRLFALFRSSVRCDTTSSLHTPDPKAALDAIQPLSALIKLCRCLSSHILNRDPLILKDSKYPYPKP